MGVVNSVWSVDELGSNSRLENGNILVNVHVCATLLHTYQVCRAIACIAKVLVSFRTSASTPVPSNTRGSILLLMQPDDMASWANSFSDKMRFVLTESCEVVNHRRERRWLR